MRGEARNRVVLQGQAEGLSGALGSPAGSNFYETYSGQRKTVYGMN